MGDYGYGGDPANNAINRADAGYATGDNWSTRLDSILGIPSGATYRGVTSLLSDMGTGTMGIVDWGSYDSTHNYKFLYIPASTNVQFIISDWWDSWYAGGVNNNQGGVWDNAGSLTLNVYQCNFTNTDIDGDGYFGNVDDCNDNDPLINPGATEVCDGVDNNCNNQTDEGLTAPPANNQNGVCQGSELVCAGTEGWVEPNYSSMPYYEANETRCDTLDNNCNGEADEGGLCEYACVSPAPADTPDVSLRTNRWIWNGSKWQTLSPKGGGKGPTFTPNMTDTHNCSCELILTWLNDNLPESYGAMNGHWKFGCSQSAIQDFIRLVDKPEYGLKVFSAADSQYYNGPTNASPLYANGPIAFTWNPVTGNVTGGYWTEQAPASTGTLYYNMVTGGTVIGDAVNLTFTRVNPNVYGFPLTGTLTGKVLTGTADGPYLFTATGL